MTKAAPILSICIPTYNFGAFIGETLESIVPQLCDAVEVVILDGGSTDDTPAVVAGFQALYPSIHYHRRPARGGIDRDMALSVDLAQGHYCWLFSADDIMHDDAIARILAAFSSDADVYLCRHSDATIDLRILAAAHPVIDSDCDRQFALADAASRRAYFRLAQSTEAFFSFMSGVVVRRAFWLAGPFDERFIGSCWSHAARLLATTLTGMTLGYLHAPLLTRRGDNDSFRDKGVVRRYAIAIEGYHGIAAAIFGADSDEAVAIRGAVHREFSLRMFLYAKTLCSASPQVESAAHLDRLVAMNYSKRSPRNLVRHAVFRLTPAWAFAAARAGVARFRSRS